MSYLGKHLDGKNDWSTEALQQACVDLDNKLDGAERQYADRSRAQVHGCRSEGDACTFCVARDAQRCLPWYLPMLIRTKTRGAPI